MNNINIGKNNNIKPITPKSVFSSKLTTKTPECVNPLLIVTSTIRTKIKPVIELILLLPILVTT
jgi:hypothetical protein